MSNTNRFSRWYCMIAVATLAVGCDSDKYSSFEQLASAQIGSDDDAVDAAVDDGFGGDTYGSGSDGGDGSGSDGGDGSGSDGGDGSGSDGGDGSGSDGGDGSGSDGGDGSGSDGGGTIVDAGTGSDSSPDASVCDDAGTPPEDAELRQALECVALMNQARSFYYDGLKAATAGYPLAASTPTNGPSPTLSQLAMPQAPPQDIFGMPASAQDAFYKAENFEPSFYADRVVTNPSLYQCSMLLSALPMEPGYFGDHYPPPYPPTYPYPPGPTPINTCLNNPPPPPAEPPINCMGVVAVAFVGYNAGEILKDGTEKCEDFTKHFGQTAATRNTGTVAMAFGGIRKPAKVGENGPDCSQSSPLIQNWEMGVAAKPAGVFVPEQILEQKPGQAAQWVANEKGKMLYYVYPDKDGKPVKRGPQCRKDTELTMRSVADMHLPYYIHARVFEDPSGRSFRSKAYQAQIDVHQRCYGPGTLVANPGAFSVVQSEEASKATLKVVKDCQKEQAWNANVNMGGTMGPQPGGSFGFGGGVSETTRCAVNLDIDNFAQGGCFANQNFGNVAMTTKKQNGPFAIGSVFQFFNPNDPAPATAPFNFLQMGMKLIGAQARATSSIDSSDVGTGGDGLATIMTDRKKYTDKPEAARAKVKLGSGGCALIAENTPRPANECAVPFPDWPFLPKTALDKVPTAQQLNDTFDALVKGVRDAAAR